MSKATYGREARLCCGSSVAVTDTCHRYRMDPRSVMEPCLALLWTSWHQNQFLFDFWGAQWARSVTEAHSQRSDRCVPSVISFLLVTLDLPAFVSAVNRVWSPGCLQQRRHPPPAAPRPVLVAGGVSTRGAFSFSWHLQLTQPGRV